VRGIETAFWGTLGGDPELRTSKSGKTYCAMSVAVTVGHDEDGKDVTQWLRVACFGATAREFAARASKQDCVYVEGNLTLNTWTNKTTGVQRSSLNVAAWRVERVSNIGKSRVRREYREEMFA
jgi:single-strand DNA-binding protein